MASSPAAAVANQPSLLRAVDPLPDLPDACAGLLVARCHEDLATVTAALAALRGAELDALSAMLRKGRLATVSSLAEVMVALVDPRDGRGVRHHLLTILVVTACAVLAGKDTWAGITRWAVIRGPAVRAALVAGGWVPPSAPPACRQRDLARRRREGRRANLTAPGAMPSEDTFARTVAKVPAAQLAAVLATWTIAALSALKATTATGGAGAAGGRGEGFVPLNARRMVASLDGQTLRGSGNQATGTHGRVHVVSAYEHASALVLAQVATGAHNTHHHSTSTSTSTAGSTACTTACSDGSDRSGKGGEVAAAKVLVDDLAARALMDGTVITGDAGFTARDLAAHIRAVGGEFLLTVKGNAGLVHERITALPWEQVPEGARVRSVGHGRVETRTIRVIDLHGSRDRAYAQLGEFYPGAAQAAKIVRRRKVNGKWQVRTIYVITSLSATEVDAALLATWVQDHWGIEVRLHWVKDVTWNQDARQVRAGNGPANLSSFTTAAINALRLTGWTNMREGRDAHQLQPLLPLFTYGLLPAPPTPCSAA